MTLTWRNVTGPNFSSANSILGQAGQSFNRGLSGLDNIIQGGIKREKQATQNNTDDFLNRVRTEFADPNDLREAQTNGGLENLRSQYASLDSKRSNATAIDGVVGSLQNRANSDAAFADTELRRSSKPFQEQIARLNAEGDFAGAKRILDEQELANEDQLISQISGAEKAAGRESERVADRGQSLSDAALRRQQGIRQDQRSEAAYQKSLIDQEKALFADKLVTDSFINNREREQLLEGKTNDWTAALQNSGIDPAQANNPAYQDTLSEDQLNILEQVQADAAQTGTLPNGDDQRTSVRDQLLDAGYSLREAQAGANRLDEANVETSGLSQVESQRRNSELASLNSKYAGSTAVQEFTNPRTTADIQNELTSSEAYKDLGNTEKKEVTALLDRMGEDGFNFNGTKVILTQGMLQQAIQRIGNSEMFGLDDGHIDEFVNRMLATPQWTNDITALKNYQQDADFINSKYQGNSAPSIAQAASYFNSINTGDTRARRQAEETASVQQILQDVQAPKPSEQTDNVRKLFGQQ